MLAGLGLAFYGLGANSLWLDEAKSWDYSRVWERFVDVVTRKEINMALYYGALHFWMRCFGESEYAIRSLSALTGVFTIFAMFLVGRRLFGIRAGLAASLLLATNPFFLAAVQEARGYALAVFLGVLSTWLLLRAIDSRKLSAWLWYTMTASLSVYAHYYAILAVLAHGLYLLSVRKEKRPVPALAISGALGLVLLAPIPWLQMRMNMQQADRFEKPHILDLLYLLETFAGGAIGATIIVAIALIGTALALKAQRGQRVIGHGPEAWRLAALWMLVPILAAFLFSFFVKPVFSPRYLIVALPGFILLLGGMVGLFKQRTMLPVLIIGALTAAQSAGIPAAYREREDWKGIVGMISDESLPGDGVCFAPGWIWEPYAYTAGRHFPAAPSIVMIKTGAKSIFLPVNWADAKEANFLGRVGSRYDRIWVVTRIEYRGQEKLKRAIQILKPVFPFVKKYKTVNGFRVAVLSKHAQRQDDVPVHSAGDADTAHGLPSSAIR